MRGDAKWVVLGIVAFFIEVIIIDSLLPGSDPPSGPSGTGTGFAPNTEPARNDGCDAAAIYALKLAEYIDQINLAVVTGNGDELRLAALDQRDLKPRHHALDDLHKSFRAAAVEAIKVGLMLQKSRPTEADYQALDVASRNYIRHMADAKVESDWIALACS
jgi:hypothetical protein